jgi:putative transposase
MRSLLCDCCEGATFLLGFPAMTQRRWYATDLTDREWALLAPLLPAAKPGGRPRSTDLREVLNALSYWLRSGEAWHLLPHDFPPWKTVYPYWRSWRLSGG